MARVQLTLPQTFIFRTELPIYVSHINRGDHVGNDAMINFMNEAGMRFFAARGIVDYCVHGTRLINADMAIEMKAEGKYGDTIIAEVGVADFHQYGCDIVYRLSSKNHGHVIALAKMGYVAFDYEQGKISQTPEGFEQFMRSPGSN